jgi:DNA-directed RNA polymerase subunit K/omega
MAEVNKEVNTEGMPIEQLILDYAKKKYVLVNAAMRWSKEIAKKEHQQQLPARTTREVLDTALRDIISGNVKMSDIAKLPVKIEEKQKTEKSEKTGKEDAKAKGKK